MCDFGTWLYACLEAGFNYLLFNGENHIREVPDERWNKKHFYSADRTQLGKTFAIHAGILKDE